MCLGTIMTRPMVQVRILLFTSSHMPYLTERAMIIILRASSLLIHKNGMHEIILLGLNLIFWIRNEIMIHIVDRLALGLTDLLRFKSYNWRYISDIFPHQLNKGLVGSKI